MPINTEELREKWNRRTIEGGTIRSLCNELDWTREELAFAEKTRNLAQAASTSNLLLKRKARQELARLVEDTKIARTDYDKSLERAHTLRRTLSTTPCNCWLDAEFPVKCQRCVALDAAEEPV